MINDVTFLVGGPGDRRCKKQVFTSLACNIKSALKNAVLIIFLLAYTTKKFYFRMNINASLYSLKNIKLFGFSFYVIKYKLVRNQKTYSNVQRKLISF